MAQREILYSELYLEKALEVNDEGKTAFEIFSNALKGKNISQENLQYFRPIINKKAANWDDMVSIGDKLQVLPLIAGGY